MGHEALSLAVEDFRHRRDNTAEHLEAILREKPDALAAVVGDGSISIEHIHPTRVWVRLSGGDEGLAMSVLEKELQQRTGKTVKVRVTR